MREFFQDRLQQALSAQLPWSHVYECSSPGVYRKFSMRVQPLPSAGGLAVVHSLVIESALSSHGAPDERIASFTDERGMIVVCESCGRVHRGDSRSWDWAPGLVGAQLQNVSHGVCSTCELRYYEDENQ